MIDQAEEARSLSVPAKPTSTGRRCPLRHRPSSEHHFRSDIGCGVSQTAPVSQIAGVPCRWTSGMPPALADLAAVRLRALRGKPAARAAAAGTVLVVLLLIGGLAWGTSLAHHRI